ncbi:Site-specific DNA recombinase [Nitrosospira multiformis]|uniref:Site-specific DNA recombinase n=1 Tax=Nitrosospira multiformis TaxID=1231 RepID=A0A1I0FTN7_9PROT|nr:recombinase family protein [Nitrosospira multiformis]SET61028.1 Site-specific DNA recombinase [Nitrosospira multiformis]
MSAQRVGYIRVSTLDQNTQRQLDGIPLDKTFTDKVSGKDINRPQLQAALNHVRAGDTLVVHSMDRLARNVEDMLRLVRELNEKGVSVEFVKENMVFTAGKEDPRSALMFTMLSAFAQFERALIKERQREGIALAKAEGKYRGRKPMLSPERVALLRQRATEKTNKSKLAEEFGISRETLYQYLREGKVAGAAS